MLLNDGPSAHLGLVLSLTLLGGGGHFKRRGLGGWLVRSCAQMGLAFSPSLSFISQQP